MEDSAVLSSPCLLPVLKTRKPKKADFRQRAHCNPLSDSFIVYPRAPECVDWSLHYPHYYGRQDSTTLYINTLDNPIAYTDDGRALPKNGPVPEILDIGCGFGGLLVTLSGLFSDKLILGMEIREKVSNYVGERIRNLREANSAAGQYRNIAVLRTNSMKFLLNYIRKGQISKIFFCFPDPHFKRSNWRRRIVNAGLLSVYAYVLQELGQIYTVTDVKELDDWMRASFQNHPCFEEVQTELEDPCVHAMENDTEEGKKVKRAGQPCYSAVYRRLAI